MGALACGLVALLFAGSGGKPMDTTLQDDAMFLHRPAAQVRASARQAAGLGATTLRLTASWSSLSPHSGARRVPGAPFDASDSATYHTSAWTALDTAVKAAAAAGLKVDMDVAFWAPRWAVRRHSRNGRERWWPDPALFGAFANAVARRYSGGFRDPANPRQYLPAVRMYTPWNEPNHPSFLAPQWIHDGRGGWRPESPHIYRAMYRAAYAAIKDVSDLNLVLLGGTSSSGSTVAGRGGVPPLEFVRTLACVDRRLRPLRVSECRGYEPLQADGFADHPYSRTTTPVTSSPVPDDAPLADTGRLERLLNALAARHRITTSLPIYETEYGYESRPDDPFAPFDRNQQAALLSWSTFLAWKDPDVRMVAQFLLRDIDPGESGRAAGTRSYYRDWQTGLFDRQGDPKPAAQAFKLPFWAQPETAPGGIGAVLVWGMVRPHRGAETVRVERSVGGGPWTPVQTWGRECDSSGDAFLTDPQGVFQRALPAGGAADYRFSWYHADSGAWEASEPIHVDPSLPSPQPWAVG